VDDYFLVSLVVLDYYFSDDTSWEHCQLHFRCNDWYGLEKLVDGPISDINDTLTKAIKMQQEVDREIELLKKGLSGVGGRPS
jgi:hypothetical protein